MQSLPRTRSVAKSLRQRMTLAEVALWNAVRANRLNGLRIRRQHPIGPYVADFYCDALRLAIEVDGCVHQDEDTRLRDEARTAWLANHRIRVLRLPNALVLTDIDQALRRIIEAGANPAP